MMNLTEFSGYFRDIITLLSVLMGVTAGLMLALKYKKKRCGVYLIIGFFLLVFDRLLWRLLTTFWLGNIYQLIGDYERIYIFTEVVSAFTFFSGVILIISSLFSINKEK